MTATPEWTDEKHSMYLKSIEASFVNQMYDSKHTLASNNPANTSAQFYTTKYFNLNKVIIAEMSDQNFADEDVEDKEENIRSNVKRLKETFDN
nr:hypothetical protein [Lupinus angustifolius]